MVPTVPSVPKEEFAALEWVLDLRQKNLWPDGDELATMGRCI
jgi:hypothetical protein